ncbi:hypothetical protein Q5P01_001000 [Channa striata]|uniref:Uncharacterized protein n=1 Tax=Channa striata TaxID=64152 RepID=A0AA88LIL6_CHASR|nr:hypothetical protein Q5P01_001000 [Channa striata]
MDQNGIQLTRKSASSWAEALGRDGAGSQAASRSRKAELSPRDTEGVVCNVAFKREAQAYEFHVKGDRTGRLYKVGLSKWHCGNWTVTTHPLACMLAMNTYDCQGCTITGDVIYHPPRNFLLSPIKPSVYVALSRVTSRDRIEMTNCNFAETVGEVRFYDDRLVAYRKRVKMESGYASWHKLTLEELIRLTSPKPKAALGHREKKPKEIPVPHRTPLDPRTTAPESSRRRDSSSAGVAGGGAARAEVTQRASPPELSRSVAGDELSPSPRRRVAFAETARVARRDVAHQDIRTDPLDTHGLSERKDSSALVPYGSYTYDSAKSYLPGGLFHFVKDVDTYVPTLHGLGQDFISRLKEVAVCEATSSMVDRPFLNAPHLYEVELINTGHESLRQGDRFTVQLPNRQDVEAQCKAEGDPGYEATVNRGIWGGLLATRRVNCEYGGDPVEEAIQAIKREPDFDVFRLISPYEPQSVLSMMSLIANGADHHLVPEGTRRMAANAVNGAFDANAVALVVQDEQAKRFLRTVIGHAMTIVESVQGFAGGQVIRACSGYNTSRIRTGERFMAQLNVNRWLL